MKIYTKLLLATLPPVLLALLVTAGVTYFLSRSALNNLAEKWLETKVFEAVSDVANKEETLRKFGLDTVPSNVQEAKDSATEALHAIKVGELGYTFAVNHEGVIVAHPDRQFLGHNVNGETWFQEMRRTQPGKLNYTWQGVSHLAIYEYFEPWGWYILATDPQSEVYGAVDQTAWYVLLLAAGGAALVGVTLMALTRGLVAPLRTLAMSAEEVGRGNLETYISVETRDEIGLLARAFNQMIERLGVLYHSLEQNEQKYRTLFEDSRDAIFITTPAGQLVDVNQATLELFGYSKAEMLQMHALEFYSEPADRARFRQAIEQNGAVRGFETRFRQKNGVEMDCLLTATIRRAEDGQILAYQGIIRDITERKQAERLLAEYSHTLEQKVAERTRELSQTLENLKNAQSQLVEAEKMAALGGLVAGVAHEINTPVGVGVTAASLLEEKTATFRQTYHNGQMKRSDLEKYLDTASQSSEMILKNLGRAAELIQSFKQVAVDQSSEERRVFAVKAYLDEILLSLHPKLKRTPLTLDIHADDSLTLDSFPGAFAQIVTNLVMNSLIHAYGPDDQGRLVFDLKQNDGCLIFVYADDGNGISRENLSKIFDPFFTTKRGHGGSGLGLHIVYNLVTQKLGGTIRCESEVGRGTRFVIEVPVSDAVRAS